MLEEGVAGRAGRVSSAEGVVCAGEGRERVETNLVVLRLVGVRERPLSVLDAAVGMLAESEPSARGLQPGRRELVAPARFHGVEQAGRLFGLASVVGNGREPCQAIALGWTVTGSASPCEALGIHAARLLESAEQEQPFRGVGSGRRRCRVGVAVEDAVGLEHVIDARYVATAEARGAASSEQ